MRIDWLPDNRPDAAHRIAEHTYHVQRQMESSDSVREVKQLYDDYMKFARAHRVCHQICEHMTDLRRNTIGSIERVKSHTTTETTKRMQGDQE